jgi:hypothetical protein
MSTPPRVAESLLEALGADADYRDAVMGDLAEEFSARALRDGADAARSWYVREAMYAVPALLRSAVRGVRARKFMHLAGLALTAFVLSRFVGGFVLMLAYRLLLSAHVVVVNDGAGGMWALLALKWSMAFASVVLGGYIAAWLHERAPLVAALVLGVLWAMTGVAVSAVLVATGAFPDRIPGIADPWLQFANAMMLIVGTTLGGVLRVVSYRLRSDPAMAR